MATYSYDNDSRLAGITYKSGSTTVGSPSYTYDAAGRRTGVSGSLISVNIPSAISSASYDAANELTNWAGAPFSYDANGNLTADGANKYVWDARNHLSSMTTSTGSPLGSFTYDPFGRRTGKTVTGTTTGFLYDGANAVQELSGSTPTANLLTGLGVDEIFTRTDSSTSTFLTDALGSTLALANSSGSVQTNYSYERFGRATVSGTASNNSFQYAGRENDGTGVYYYRARYYAPVYQRFVSEDPIRFRGGINFYAYVGSNPISRIDPFGLDWQDDLLKNASDFSAGAGSALTFGLTDVVNNWTGASSVVNKCSGWHTLGNVTGIALSTAIGAEGLPSGLSGLSNGAKGAIGEGLSVAENTLSGSTLVGTQVSGEGLGLSTVFDSVWQSSSGEIYYVESKFGTAGLTAAQRAAANALGDAYQVERWGYSFFSRVGGYLGFGYGAAGSMAGRNCGCN